MLSSRLEKSGFDLIYRNKDVSALTGWDQSRRNKKQKSELTTHMLVTRATLKISADDRIALVI